MVLSGPSDNRLGYIRYCDRVIMVRCGLGYELFGQVMVRLWGYEYC